VNRILAYGLAGLLIEVSRGRTEPTCSQFEEQADFLRSCKSERQAQTAIAQLMKISANQVTHRSAGLKLGAKTRPKKISIQTQENRSPGVRHCGPHVDRLGV
jgi:hypothetical protein